MQYCKVDGSTFRYNGETHCVELVAKVSKEMKDQNDGWNKRFGKPLWGVGDDGYSVLDEAGLSRATWDNVDMRTGYLREWLREQVVNLGADFL
jgi:hypothetical protein